MSKPKKFPVRVSPNGAPIMIFAMGLVPLAIIGIPAAVVVGGACGAVLALVTTSSTLWGGALFGAALTGGVVGGGFAAAGAFLVGGQVYSDWKRKKTHKDIEVYIAEQNKLRPDGYTTSDYERDLLAHEFNQINKLRGAKNGVQKKHTPKPPQS